MSVSKSSPDWLTIDFLSSLPICPLKGKRLTIAVSDFHWAPFRSVSTATASGALFGR
jgi:hypothetical protein